jgi:hypothetical protein
MKRIISALVLITAAGIGAAGCSGDDDDSNNGTAGKGNSAGSPGTGDGGEPGTASGGAPPNSGNVMCDPTEDGVCQNDTDCPGVASGAVRMAAGVCGLGESISAKDSACAIACIVKATDATEACADCYGAAVACTLKNCFLECKDDPEADECKACQVDKGCRGAFNTCSGLPE